MFRNYWSRTDEYLNQTGSSPNCIHCGEKMFPMDDHGRFKCFCRRGVGSVADISSGHPVQERGETFGGARIVKK